MFSHDSYGRGRGGRSAGGGVFWVFCGVQTQNWRKKKRKIAPQMHSVNNINVILDAPGARAPDFVVTFSDEGIRPASLPSAPTTAVHSHNAVHFFL